jgi:pilus assembly protein CpaF
VSVKVLGDRPLVERVRDRLVDSGSGLNEQEIVAAVRAEGVVLSAPEAHRLCAQVRSELFGAGPLQPLLEDPEVTDVLVNGPDSVFVDRGSGLVRSAVRFADHDAIRRLAQRLAMAAGRRLDSAQPFVDAQTPDGVRLHAVLPPIARGSALLSLRIPRRRVLTLADLVRQGGLDSVGALWLAALVHARASYVITGGTGSGKTTVLSTLLELVPERERLVIVEDSAELEPQHPHAALLQARPANVEGAGSVTLTDLVRQAMRMRPDRLVVGEVRGVEVIDLLSALNTGHEGGCATVHANSAADLPARIEALAAPAGWPRAAIHAQLAAGLDAVVHLRRSATGKRTVWGVGVLCRDGELVSVQPAVLFEADRVRPGPGLAQLRRRLGGFAPPLPGMTDGR